MLTVVSKQARIKDIRANREQEKIDQRKDEAFDLSEGSNSSDRAPVIDLHTGKDVQKDYRYPRRKKRVKSVNTEQEKQHE